MHGSEVRGLLSPFLLLLIHERPGHGYDLIDRLSCLGVAGAEPGHVYKVLRHLEREHLVVSMWVTSHAGPARRRYELTPRGLAELETEMTRLAELDEVLGTCLARWENASAAPAGEPRNGQARCRGAQ